MPIAYYNVHSVPGRVVQNSSAVVPGGIAGTARSLVCSPRTMSSFLPYTSSDMLLSGHLLPFGKLNFAENISHSSHTTPPTQHQDTTRSRKKREEENSVKGG